MQAPRYEAQDRPLSALPSPLARALAFAAIVVAGLCGALIGWAFVDLQCEGSCTAAGGIGAVVGGVGAAAGVAVVAVLTLRAMGEWKRVDEERLFDDSLARPPEPPAPAAYAAPVEPSVPPELSSALDDESPPEP